MFGIVFLVLRVVHCVWFVLSFVFNIVCLVMRDRVLCFVCCVLCCVLFGLVV